MTNEVIAVYVVAVLQLGGAFLNIGLTVYFTKRANNQKSVARHEANFVRLQQPVRKNWDVEIELEDQG